MCRLVQFAQVIFSLTAFIILPFTCQHILRVSALAFSLIVLLSALITSVLLLPYPWPWMAMYMLLHLTLVFVCPAYMLSAHKLKTQINGPWDEAVPRLMGLVHEMSHSFDGKPPTDMHRG
jgi:hypothetical protein